MMNNYLVITDCNILICTVAYFAFVNIKNQLFNCFNERGYSEFRSIMTQRALFERMVSNLTI
jgi:uncharacterized membrane protein YjgN (DUF898 family)